MVLMTNTRQQLKQNLQDAIQVQGENLWPLKYARLISLALHDQQSLLGGYNRCFSSVKLRKHKIFIFLNLLITK